MIGVLHHWDTDGICSAAIIKDEFKDASISNFIPQIGKYSLNKDEIQKLKQFKKLYIVDLNLSQEQLQKIREATSAKIYFYDHHTANNVNLENFKFVNPIAKGENIKKYPSNTWVLSEKLNRDTDLLKVLGAIGDREEKIKDNKEIYKEIKSYLNKKDLTYKELDKSVNLLDSSYKINKREEVTNLVDIAYQANNHGIETILENQKLNSNIKELEEEITRVLQVENEDIDNILIKKINTPYNIISSITRKLSWNQEKPVIIINEGFLNGKNQIYVRTNNIDLRPLISKLKDRYSLGGKKEVIGSVIPNKKSGEFLKKVKNYLNNN